MRLDQALVDRGLAPTRARARDAVMRGHVKVDGIRAQKPAASVAPTAAITIDDPAAGYVSRSALKLIAALDAFGFSPRDRVALDVGASTGGFTQVLIERGATRVHAIDVGHGQLHQSIASDPRVVARNGLNARSLALTDIGEQISAIVVDVSFISLRLVLPAVFAVATPNAWAALLVKPQFEVGRERVGKGGLVKDEAARAEALEAVSGFFAASAWPVQATTDSPIEGGDGNREFLLWARKG
jgi:23S rRNA (cytidine1920-2'-O)/16S rRNA (cytidine1409-2'-O)-methyltransferase